MNHKESFWRNCKALVIDHFAATTSNLEDTLIDYLGLPGARLLRGPDFNSAQNVDYAFVQLNAGSVIEILGVREGSPIATHVQSGGGAYHLCFEVEDITESISLAERSGARLVVEPRADEAFDGREVAFLMHQHHGLFEFLARTPKNMGEISDGVIDNSAEDRRVTPVLAIDSVKEGMCQVFLKIFPSLTLDSCRDAVYSETQGWDSLKHLLLVMEIEKKFEIRFSADIIGTLSSFDKCLSEVNKMVT